MQPAWRKDDEAPLVHFRDIPKGETWQALRKGGTAGIYVVVMALSWWIKGLQHDVNAWSAVDDLSWVIRNMSRKAAASVPVPKKRAHDEDGGDQDQGLQRKR